MMATVGSRSGSIGSMLGSRARLMVSAMLAVSVMMLAGCASFDKRLMKPDVKIQDHAVLYLEETLDDVSVDGVRVYGGGCTILVPPGEHAVKARYSHQSFWGVMFNYRTVSGHATVEYDFKPDTHYYMHSFKPDKKTKERKFEIIEDTDPARINKGKQDKKSLIK